MESDIRVSFKKPTAKAAPVQPEIRLIAVAEAEKIGAIFTNFSVKIAETKQRIQDLKMGLVDAENHLAGLQKEYGSFAPEFDALLSQTTARKS